jgi:hypothetical protein
LIFLIFLGLLFLMLFWMVGGGLTRPIGLRVCSVTRA